LSLISTSIKGKNDERQITIVGPNRMSYSNVQGILNFIKDEIEKQNGK